MRDLEWRHLKGLYQIYTVGSTRLKITGSTFVSQILIKQKKLVRFKSGNHNVLEKSPLFDYYFKNELLQTYLYYSDFFTNCNLENDARKTFTEQDLKTLLFIYNNREELKKKLTTEYTFSARVFNNGSKYLSHKSSLKKAVLQILGITEFPEKDPKNNLWRFVIDCPNPKMIVLCENLSCLKVPFEYKANGIELWYVGGNNTAPLLDISPEKLNMPIYYLCDWDYNGMLIYSRVKKILKDKDIDVVLIEPDTLDMALPVDSKHHKSQWKPADFSGLVEADFNGNQISLINNLIAHNKWIEEESMDLISLLRLKALI